MPRKILISTPTIFASLIWALLWLAGVFTTSAAPNQENLGQAPANQSVLSGTINSITHTIYLPCIKNRYPYCYTVNVSVSSEGVQGDNWSSELMGISADGRYVVFASEASNLVSGDTNGSRDIFVYDSRTRQTRRVSVSSNGEQGNHDAFWPSISDDGRYITFYSRADNLVAGDINGLYDVFLHDLQTGETRRVSVASNGAEGKGASGNAAVSGDGHFVTYSSVADNLVKGDTNSTMDIFVYEIATGSTQRVSLASNKNEANGHSTGASISADGRYIAFASLATNLGQNDTNEVYDVFVHDRETGVTSQVSTAMDNNPGNGLSYEPNISANGQFITFWSEATNLVTGDTNAERDVFLYDQQTGGIQRVSIASDGTQANGNSEFSTVSGDGRFVVFESDATNLVSNDTQSFTAIFIHDTVTYKTSRVALNQDGISGNSGSLSPHISANGLYVAFASGSSNLVLNDTNGQWDVFLSNCR